PPPAPPDFKGAAPTMHYGEAPVPPKKKTKSSRRRSTAARAAEAARAAVWAVSSEKTTAQIEAAENAFEVALSEHKAEKRVEKTRAAEKEAAAATADEVATPPRKAGAKASAKAAKGTAKGAGKAAPPPPPPPRAKGHWAFFRAELARPSDPDDPHEAWRKDMGRPRHEMFHAATDEQLDAIEADLGMKLPLSYRDFNRSWGGGRLFTQEWRDIRLVGAIDMAKEMKERLCERMQKPFLPLADLGDGDYLAFDTSKATQKGEAPVYWWYGGKAKKRVAASFSEWLEQLVATGGEAFWWEEP
ncbi:SMI1/KNR4 family protein, partial [bacterium]|nr:SMI1/KNR4 family protein [bacterium]